MIAALTAPGAPFETTEALVRGRSLRVWKHAPATLREVFDTARLFGDREFLVLEGDRATYDGFVRASLVLAADLVARGVRRGDRVAIVMRNRPQWPVAFFAAILAGAIATPLGVNLAAAELDHALEDCGAAAAVVDGGALRLLPAAPRERLLYVCGRGGEPLPPGAVGLEALLGEVGAWGALPQVDPPRVDLQPDDDAAIFYTSGTTGRAKGAIASHRNFTAVIRVVAFAQARMAMLQGRGWTDPDPLEARPNCTLLVAPLFHVTSCCAGLIPTIMRGGKFVFMDRWSPEAGMALIEREKVNATGGVPTIARQLAEHPDRDRYDLSSLRFVQYGGAPAGKDLPGRIAQSFNRAVATDGYGLTETTSVFCSHSGHEVEARPDSCGLPPPVNRIRIVDRASGKACETGEVGEVWLQGAQVVRGYWNRPLETAAAFVDGWLRTGDLGRLDADGRLYLTGRAKDVIIRAGENIHCGEVESVLLQHPAVAEAAVVSLPDPPFGEAPAAVVVLRAGETVTERALRSFVRERLSLFKTPVKVAFRDQPLPRNDGGKVMKRELRAVFAHGNAPAPSPAPDRNAERPVGAPH